MTLGKVNNGEPERIIKSGSQEEITKLFKKWACHLIEYHEKLEITTEHTDEVVGYAFKSLKKFDPELGKAWPYFCTVMSCGIRQIHRRRKNEKARP